MSGKYVSTIDATGLPGNAETKRYINILLVRYPDICSILCRLLSGGYYNHASIGVSDSDGTFYSYVITGFRIEIPKKHPTFKRREIPCRLYRLEVSEEIYDVVKATLEDHTRQRHKHKYSYLGMFLCFMRIVYISQNRYFCSQFVSEVLDQVRAVPLSKHSALYLPDDFIKMKELDLCYTGYLSQLVQTERGNL